MSYGASPPEDEKVKSASGPNKELSSLSVEDEVALSEEHAINNTTKDI
tara:strand:+ start:34 stop:177 length:144 start_codon:yes stop_codon:yes gene_type:complete